MNKQGKTYDVDSTKDIATKYDDLLSEIKDALDFINASNYSKKSLGRFKELIENAYYDYK